MLSARKSAELLAKFIYMAAHATALQEQTFADILADYQVRKFINDRHVMDAFHYIRIHGNKAVHGEQEADSETALSVLQNLHFVAGETAKDLDLISSYPDFDENIAYNPEASFNEDIQITEKAMAMFIEYVEKHERDNQGRFVTFDLYNPAHLAYALHGRVDMHERIEFDHQPYYKSTLDYLQQYVSYLNNMAQIRCQDTDSDPALRVKIIITIDGNVVYTDEGKEQLISVLTELLPNAKSFTIDCDVLGNLRSFYGNPDPNAIFGTFNEEDLWQGRGMADQLEALKRKEKFVYKAVFWYPDDGSHTEFAYIRNGKSYDVEDICKPDILQKAKDCAFCGNSISMYADFDYKAYPKIVQQLREAVRSYLSDEDHLSYIEELWEENDEEGYSGDLLAGYSIIDNDLSQSQKFADQVNRILEPIADQCTIYVNSAWWDKEKPDPEVPSLEYCFYDHDKFGIASFVWEDQKLQLVGTIL